MSRRPQVVLYNPTSVFYTMPLGPLAVASSLDRTTCDVRIIDGRLETDPVAAVLQSLGGAVALGMSVLTGEPIRDALRVSRAAKARFPNLPIVWGGWHPSLFPVETLAEPSIDIAVLGQGEATFAALLERLVDRSWPGADLDDIAGLAVRRDGEVVRTPARPMVPMNDLPPVDYSLLPVDAYFGLKQQRQLDYITSIGCHFRCAFCADPFVYERRWTGLAPSRIGEEVEALWRRHAFTELAFQDETFFTYRDRAEAMADDFLQRGLSFEWTATLRADQAVRLGEAGLALCVRSGLRRVLVGVESGSQEMLDWMLKDVTVDQVLETAAMCVRLRLGAIFPFIVGFPGESDESVRASVDLIKRLRAMSPEFETPLFYFKPYPGSRITDDLVQQGHALPTTLEAWADFDFIGSSGPWVSDDKYQWLERFKFYNRFSGGAETWRRWPLQRLARWRCRRDFYEFPIERAIVERLRPSTPLS